MAELTDEQLKEIDARWRDGNHTWHDVKRLIDSLKSARAEAKELQAGFDLRWKADMRAIAMWRGDDPTRQLTMPDHTDLCVWLLNLNCGHLEQIATLRRERAALREFAGKHILNVVSEAIRVYRKHKASDPDVVGGIKESLDQIRAWLSDDSSLSEPQPSSDPAVVADAGTSAGDAE